MALGFHLGGWVRDRCALGGGCRRRLDGRDVGLRKSRGEEDGRDDEERRYSLEEPL